jgi:hypothetical protein
LSAQKTFNVVKTGIDNSEFAENDVRVIQKGLSIEFEVADNQTALMQIFTVEGKQIYSGQM